MKKKLEFWDKAFWQDHTLVAVDRCKMDFNREEYALTIGRTYKPILKELTREEFAIKDDQHDFHWFDWETISDYFKVVKRPPKVNK